MNQLATPTTDLYADRSFDDNGEPLCSLPETNEEKPATETVFPHDKTY